MNTTELKKLAERCICHPLSSSVREVENAGEAIKELLAINAELVEALKKISAIELKEFGADWEEIEEAQDIADAALAKAEGGEL